jgi:hypothetical protein
MKNEMVRARFVENDCEDCCSDLLQESKRLGGLPLSGEVVLIPRTWLTHSCPHGRLGLKFLELEEDDRPSGSSELSHDSDKAEPSGEPDREYSSMDATKNIGYPVREHGPYGSHPVRDDFDDESDADGPGIYPGLRK